MRGSSSSSARDSGSGLARLQSTFALDQVPPGSSGFLDIDLEPDVPYTLTGTSGNRPIVTTFTPAETHVFATCAALFILADMTSEPAT